MLKQSCLLLGALVLASSAGAQSTSRMQRLSSEAPPIHAGTYYVATGEFVPAVAGETSSFQGGTSDVIYANNNYTAVFYDINDDTTVFDEGRVPSLTSPVSASPVSFAGTANSYRITDIQFAYATDAPMGSTISARVGLFNQYDTCTAPEANGVPILDLQVTGLPGTVNPGGLTPYTFDINMTGFEFCMRADGDGKYDDEISDRFGWALNLTSDPGTQTGPIVGARPGVFAPTGDATTFQNPGASSGSGLSTVDQWFDRNPADGDNCFNEGGYNPATGNPAFGSFWLVLGSDLSASCVGCADRIDDDFEDNDTCLDAVPLAPGTYQNLLTREQGDDPDFYRVTIPAGGFLDATAAFLHIASDIDLNVFSSDCSTLITSSGGTTDIENVRVFNCGATPADVVLEVFVFGFGANTGCGVYELILETDEGCVAMDDGLEDNDSCADAVQLPEGFTPNLRVSVCDLDYYRITLKNGEMLDVTMTLDDSVSDLDLFLYLDDATCDTFAGVLDASLSTTGIENVSLENTSGQTQSYILRVDVFSQFTSVGCAAYDLNFDRTGGTPIGEKFCFSNPNSTGAGAHIFATGSATVADDAFTLNAQFLPSMSNGYFITSMGQVFVPNPAGSEGNLCIAGAPVGRFNNDVQNTGAGSTVSFSPDFNMWPQPTGFITLLAGDTWNFQYWYRDISSMNNFTDAVQVMFN
jgi:hypothetical protein